MEPSTSLCRKPAQVSNQNLSSQGFFGLASGVVDKWGNPFWTGSNYDVGVLQPS